MGCEESWSGHLTAFRSRRREVDPCEEKRRRRREPIALRLGRPVHEREAVKQINNTVAKPTAAAICVPRDHRRGSLTARSQAPRRASSPNPTLQSSASDATTSRMATGSVAPLSGPMGTPTTRVQVQMRTIQLELNRTATISDRDGLRSRRMATPICRLAATKKKAPYQMDTLKWSGITAKWTKEAATKLTAQRGIHVVALTAARR